MANFGFGVLSRNRNRIKSDATQLKLGERNQQPNAHRPHLLRCISSTSFINRTPNLFMISASSANSLVVPFSQQLKTTTPRTKDISNYEAIHRHLLGHHHILLSSSSPSSTNHPNKSNRNPNLPCQHSFELIQSNNSHNQQENTPPRNLYSFSYSSFYSPVISQLPKDGRSRR